METLRPRLAAILRKFGRDETLGDPPRRLFARIRWKLTLWFSGVVAAALILSGVVLYLAVQQSLLGALDDSLKTEARSYAAQWRQVSPFGPGPVCPTQGPQDRGALIACYGPNGNRVGQTDVALFYPSFVRESVLDPGGAGAAGDTVSTHYHGAFSAIRRYAVGVPGLGVLQVGLPVGSQLTTLATLLRLLLILGALTLLLAFALGLFLANRALLPARLAYARQRDFIADASHELRTPLTMMRSSMEVVLRRRDRLSEEDATLLDDAVEAATHLSAIASSMLDLIRLDSGESRLEEEVVDLGSVAETVAGWSRALAAERGITLDVGGSDGAVILGDRHLLERAVLIVVDNAVKYNRPGGSVSLLASSQNGRASLAVSDTGVGVAAEHLEKLGERFYRVDKARSRESGGVGLGLSIVRSVVERHGGSMAIESRPGEGTTVRLSFPAVRGRGTSYAS